MNYAVVAAVIGAILLLVKRMMDRARTDKVMAELRPSEAKAKAEQYAKELARLEQEVKDADIRYSDAKRAAEQPSSSTDKL